MSFGSGVRAQVFEVIVRQAIAGAPWREICAGPMLVNSITPEEIETEVYRRLHKGKEELSPEERTLLEEYIEGWHSVLQQRKLKPLDQIEEAVTAFYLRQHCEKPAIVVCKSPAMMYLHLMLLTEPTEFNDKDDINRAVSILAQDQTEKFRNNLSDSVETLLSNSKSRPASYLAWKDNFARLREIIATDMREKLDDDVNNYFQWGFRAAIGPLPARLSTVYDAALTNAQRITNRSAEFPDEAVVSPAMRVRMTNPIIRDPGREFQLPGGVLRYYSTPIWQVEQLLAPGFVVESLKAGELFSNFVRDQVPEFLSLFKAAPMYAFFEKVCLVADYPDTVIVDQLFRPNNRNGASIIFPDDYQVHAIDGIIVPRMLIERPQDLTLADIEEVENVALRRVMIEIFGTSRYLMDSGAKLVHEDEFGQLYRKELPDDEPIVMLCVINSTMEPDGTYRKYFLRVPPRTSTARQGVAWTFSMGEVDYRPTMQT